MVRALVLALPAAVLAAPATNLAGSMMPGATNLATSDSLLKTKLQTVITSVWNNPSEPDDTMTVVDASAGTWTATTACPAPALYVFVTGHYRTFSYTMENLAKMAKHSSNDCYKVIAVMPQDVCWRNPDTVMHPNQCAPFDESPMMDGKTVLDYTKFTTDISTAGTLLRSAQSTVFKGKLAFLTIKSTGRYDLYPTTSEPRMHLLYSLANETAFSDGVSPDQFTPVIVSRPDLLFTTSFDFTNTKKLFASQYGGRIAFGQDGAPATTAMKVAKSEVLMFTSWMAYKTHIAAPLKEAEALRAMVDSSDYSYAVQFMAEHNHWGAGYSQEGILPSGEACACVQESTTDTNCVLESCLLNVLEGYTATEDMIKLDVPNSTYVYDPVDTSSPHDLTAACFPYSPWTLPQPSGYSMVTTDFKPWIDELNYHFFYRRDSALKLVSSSGSVASFSSIWPAAYVTQYENTAALRKSKAKAFDKAKYERERKAKAEEAKAKAQKASSAQMARMDKA